MKKLLIFIVLFPIVLTATQTNRWEILKDGAIIWNVKKDIPHADHIEMSGEMLSCVLRYGVSENGNFYISNRTIVWPMLRKIPNNTRGGLIDRFAPNFIENISANGIKFLKNERVKSLKLNGLLTVTSEFKLNDSDKNASLKLTRIFFPSPTKPVFCEIYEFENISDTSIELNIPPFLFEKRTEAKNGVDGNIYLMTEMLENYSQGKRTLKSGESFKIFANIQARKDGQKICEVDYKFEEQSRKNFVKKMWSNLVLETPDETINKMFAFAKIRGAESIYKTSGGYMHGPGGENYYAAIWANDQAEYINPFFPFLGYDLGNNSAFNSFKHWSRFINPEFKPIPASIIAEGKDHWSVAGDRGDAAMIAYGAARYALARADKNEAKEIWALIEWCLEYCKRKIIEGGVVASRSDELEGRFPSGKANLCTSSLYYDALISASYLAKSLDMPESISSEYTRQANNLKTAIENYFGAKVEGFETYKYYETNTILRSWICIPLTVGIFDRKEGTLKALFSERLWTKDGLLTQAGDKTFWDRSTLYGLRAAFASGATETGLKYLKDYSETRLLGEHVPYAIEAWPEGGKRHLSAENGLYCRIITEGIFGIRPTGFDSFTMTPRLPNQWKEMSLKNIFAFSKSPFDIKVKRHDKILEVTVNSKSKVLKSYKIKDGETIKFEF